jgi:hypothetical protein
LAVAVPLAFFVVSRFSANSYWAPRQMIGAAAMLSIVIAVGLSRCPIALRTFALIALFLCVASSTWFNSPESQHPAWNRIAQTAAEECRDCRVVAFEWWVSGPLSYYLDRPVDIINAVPESKEPLVLVCRDSNCTVKSYPAGFRHIVQYGTGANTARLQLCVTGN